MGQGNAGLVRPHCFKALEVTGKGNRNQIRAVTSSVMFDCF